MCMKNLSHTRTTPATYTHSEQMWLLYTMARAAHANCGGLLLLYILCTCKSFTACTARSGVVNASCSGMAYMTLSTPPIRRSSARW